MTTVYHRAIQIRKPQTHEINTNKNANVNKFKLANKYDLKGTYV